MADELTSARNLIYAEAAALRRAAHKLGAEFELALDLLEGGRSAFYSGVGKSGHVAAHIAAKMRSCGFSSWFVHPTDALHGDMGAISDGSVVVAISRSGECDEIVSFVQSAKAVSAVKVVAITGGLESRLAGEADVVIDAGADEAVPDSLVPTSSTAAAMAIGDALTLALQARVGRGVEDFKRTHPGGVLGQ